MLPDEFTQNELEYAQEHLRITPFCYGLLRPLDLINPYRLEGGIVLLDKAHGGVLRIKDTNRQKL